jgi:hypothetical protein
MRWQSACSGLHAEKNRRSLHTQTCANSERRLPRLKGKKQQVGALDWAIRRLALFTYGIVLSEDVRNPCRQTPKLAFGCFVIVLHRSEPGYPPKVAAYQRPGLETRLN